MNLLFTMLVSISMIIMTLNHPLSMGLILIMQTMIMSLIIGYMMESFFLSYIIMIMILSGALVLFIYMASIASNEKFYTPMMNMLLFITMTILFFLFMYMFNKNYLNCSMETNESSSMIKLYNTISSQMTLTVILYLLLTMIAVSNVAKVSEGPLRMKK
uniref:NADH dehydrogenase subunit 6 n=1 Tax=Piezodorus guildinii TaxID=437484 RepID=UPI002551D282|nr:NADH dehydrogenase subunit 6 [Piezodorus guildinii]WGT93138.1 NADH dehydrogenase subunit 6 [Piezodorus guildinii]